MPVDISGPPAEIIYRIGRGHPWQWPDWRYVGDSRFDDPARRFRVLYAGDRRACFLETLAPFRPGLHDADQAGKIPQEWFATRRLAQFSLSAENWQALDLRSSRTVQELRSQFGSLFAKKGYQEFDFSHALSQDIGITQSISAWAYDNGFKGILYRSRFAIDQTCIAIFEGSQLSDVQASPIDQDDPDLLWAADILRLTFPT
jgi:hypothetical protein